MMDSILFSLLDSMNNLTIQSGAANDCRPALYC